MTTRATILLILVFFPSSARSQVVGDDFSADSVGQPTRTSFVDAIPRLVSGRVRRLSNEQQALSEQLRTLPPFIPYRDVRAGFHSGYSDGPQWVQIDLGRPFQITAVALVPASVYDNAYVDGYGFPLRFRVEVANDPEFEDARLIHDRTADDFPNPGRYPDVITGLPVRARYVRVTSINGARKPNHFFALGELIVLSGMRNVALWRPVRASSSIKEIKEQIRWKLEYLVDENCILPLPVGTVRSRTGGYKSAESHTQSARKWIELDLGKVFPVDEVRIFPAHPDDQAHAVSLGFPSRFKLELLRRRGDEPVVLAEFVNRYYSYRPLIIPVGSRRYFTEPNVQLGQQSPPLELPAVSVPARYVRLEATDLDPRIERTYLALSEIQVYANNINEAPTAEVTVSDVAESDVDGRWHPEYLVDDNTSQHNIIELPRWLKGIDDRRALEARLIATSLELKQATSWVWAFMGVIVAGLMLSFIAALVWLNRQQHHRMRRQTEQLRERLASDLHDDIGSNLGTIALISQTAQDNEQLPDQLRDDITEIYQIAMETSEAMRDMIWLLRAAPMKLDDFVAHLRRTASRMLPTYEVQFPDAEHLSSENIQLVWRRNVFLAFKEVLHNVARHSQASNVTIKAETDNGHFSLTIQDDGSGFDVQQRRDGYGVDNVQRRLLDLGGTARFTCDQGTIVVLNAPLAQSPEP